MLGLTGDLASCDADVSIKKYDEMGDLCCHGNVEVNRELYTLGLQYYRAEVGVVSSGRSLGVSIVARVGRGSWSRPEAHTGIGGGDVV